MISKPSWRPQFYAFVAIYGCITVSAFCSFGPTTGVSYCNRSTAGKSSVRSGAVEYNCKRPKKKYEIFHFISRNYMNNLCAMISEHSADLSVNSSDSSLGCPTLPNVSSVDPWAVPPTSYDDKLFDKVMINIICSRMSDAFGEIAESSPTYDTFVNLARQMQIKYPNPAMQREVIMNMLIETVPSWILKIYRQVMVPCKTTAELNAFFCGKFSNWLVGPITVDTSEILLEDGRVETWRSSVKVQRCRYLESSRCKGACMNLCKIPTETFFANQMGMPMRMEPNFDDLSCVFTFGIPPMPLSEDELAREPCFRNCPASSLSNIHRKKPCDTMPEI